ncbi:PHA/PHB synthase family protein [Fodinicola acaciae]|uniref:PHA/PHB synthase family protein n=1 Tax=Fodinicola acaciae TaxID=2681555 RepID=UPI0013CFB532|nr:alpha/beta fold hydrolase [Fodinicola acaciae]
MAFSLRSVVDVAVRTVVSLPVLAADAVAASELSSRIDPAGLREGLAELARALGRDPGLFNRIATETAADSVRLTLIAALRGAGLEIDDEIEFDRTDPRFTDPAWLHNAWYFHWAQQHAAFVRHLRQLVLEAELDDDSRAKATLAVEQIAHAIAPSNFPASNPTAVKEAFDTGGASVVRGGRNLVRDLVSNAGRPLQVNHGAYTLGQDLATTKGGVVFRDRLCELIQYEPRTPKTYATPMLFVPPWINKYYLLDLAPGRSLVDWTVHSGHTSFAISYRNPDESIGSITLDDYLTESIRPALAAIRDITGSPLVNVTGFGMGGTLAAVAADSGVSSLTLLGSLLDFSEPGPVGLAVEEALERLDRLPERALVPGATIAAFFDAVRADPLRWRFLVNDWMLGREPPASDVMTWNGDTVRVPAAALASYLRTFYLNNRFADGTLALAGRAVTPSSIRAAAYVVAGQADQLAPWRSAYASLRLLPGPTRFVLASGGRVRSLLACDSFLSGDGPYATPPDQWFAGAQETPGSWWPDWTNWLSARSGKLRRPPTVGNHNHRVLADAPGRYAWQR